MPLQIPGAPAAIVAALTRLQEDLVRVAGKNLASIVLFGGLARGRFRPGKSDVNVVILLHEASGPALAAITPALQAAWRAAAVEPMILTPADINPAVEVFPTKFLDIKRHHIVLFGEDPFATLEARPEHIRLRVKQDLHNLLLRLRRRYIASGKDDAMLAQALVDAARPLALDLVELLRLAGKNEPADDRSATIFDAAANAFGLDRDILSRLAALRQDARADDQLADLAAGVLATLGRVTDVIDGMQESPR